MRAWSEVGGAENLVKAEFPEIIAQHLAFNAGENRLGQDGRSPDSFPSNPAHGRAIACPAVALLTGRVHFEAIGAFDKLVQSHVSILLKEMLHTQGFEFQS